MEFNDVVRTRRSVREYSDDSVDRETLDNIFEAATLSPSGYNLQPWEFLVLRDAEKRDAS